MASSSGCPGGRVDCVSIAGNAGQVLRKSADLHFFRQNTNFFKKVLDKTGERWYSIKAVARDSPGERVSEKKNLKKDEKSS